MAKTRTVYSTQDDGAGTLRDALRATPSYTEEWINAGTLANGDIIDFSDALEVDGVISILLSSSITCPQLTLTIDGGATWTENGDLKTRVVLDGQSSIRIFVTASSTSRYLSMQGITFKNGYAPSGNGAGYYSQNNSNANDIRNCVFDNCVAVSGGAVMAYNESKNNFTNCYFINCSATTNGGAFFCSGLTTNANSFNNCVFKNCSAANGGALYLRNSSATINNATFANNTATNGGDIYIYAGLTVDVLTAPSGVYVAANAAFTISQRAEVGSLSVGNGATVTFSGVDSILAATTTASVGSATFTAAADSNGFLAVPVNTNVSSATFTGVVACNYGAGITAFRYRYPNVIYTATNISIPALLQKSDSGSQPWTSVALISESPYNYDQSTPTTFRLFDGATFLYSAFSGVGKHFETTAKFPIGYLVTKNIIGYLN